MNQKIIDHIEVDQAGSAGRWYARPAGQLATCGFHPYPWTVCAHMSKDKARMDFYNTHKGKIHNYLNIED